VHLTPGQIITSGTVYRCIPNWEGYFDYDDGVPELVLFVPRRQDDMALSAHLDEQEATRALQQPRLAGFGLCALDIETMTRVTAARVRVVAARSESARSHVRILGATDSEIRALLASIAKVIRAPKAPRL
jgi:hypothetical protein